MRTEIVFEDKDILVCYKPSGLATQSARPGQMDMVSELKNYLAATGGKNPYIGMVHRLDQPVEGLLVFAKNKAAAAKLSKQLENHTLTKTYWAVVCGKPSERKGCFVDFLKKDSSTNCAVVVSKKDKDAKEASLSYQCLKTIEMDEKTLSLMEISIETGRFHQIRVQMAHHGFPLIGDSKYGVENTDEEIKKFTHRLGVLSVALCAKSICFRHLTNGQMIEFDCTPKNKIFTYFADTH